jgi:hypothetical protein
MKLCLLPHALSDASLSAFRACISVGNAGFLFLEIRRKLK